METIVNRSEAGFTLVEFLVALVIALVGVLGLLQTVNFAIHHNMSNQLRQEALVLADETINLEKSQPFDSIVVGPARNFNASRMVNGAARDYAVTVTNTGMTAQSKAIDLQVSWNYKGQTHNHSISTVVSKAE